MVLASLRDRFTARRVAAALRSISQTAERYSRVQGLEATEGVADAERADLYASARIGRKAPRPVVDALIRWDAHHLLAKARLRLVDSVRAALAAGASIAEVEAHLAALHPHDIPGVLALGGEPIELGRLRFQAELLSEWLRLLRSENTNGGGLERWWLNNRRLAALVRLDVIEALIHARRASIPAAEIAATTSSLQPQDAQVVLETKDEEWSRRRRAKLRRQLRDRPPTLARPLLEELGWLDIARPS